MQEPVVVRLQRLFELDETTVKLGDVKEVRWLDLSLICKADSLTIQILLGSGTPAPYYSP